jgi:hypothetical protein
MAIRRRYTNEEVRRELLLSSTPYLCKNTLHRTDFSAGIFAEGYGSLRGHTTAAHARTVLARTACTHSNTCHAQQHMSRTATHATHTN